ncbi:MAG: TIGR03936 family radical SAM-associated protein [Oscillospiraceae bacterium]
MDKLRLRFEKTGRAVYISHLDLMRVMQRVFLRAGCNIKYSEGFNPHAIISVCLPLSVGCASLCELMDFRVEGDADLEAMPEKLTASMPEGIRVTSVYEPERKITALKWLKINGRLDYDGRDSAAMLPGLREFFSRDTLTVTRKTKRGEGEFDLAPNIFSTDFTPEEGFVRLEAIISAQDPTVNPELLIAALRQSAPELAPDFAYFTRLEIFDENMNLFR